MRNGWKWKYPLSNMYPARGKMVFPQHWRPACNGVLCHNSSQPYNANFWSPLTNLLPHSTDQSSYRQNKWTDQAECIGRTHIDLWRVWKVRCTNICSNVIIWSKAHHGKLDLDTKIRLSKVKGTRATAARAACKNSCTQQLYISPQGSRPHYNIVNNGDEMRFQHHDFCTYKRGLTCSFHNSRNYSTAISFIHITICFLRKSFLFLLLTTTSTHFHI